MKNAGDTCFYIGKFKRFKKVKIVDVRERIQFDYYGCCRSFNEYMIEFEDGKMRIVHENKLF